jgi:Ca-activated chloride channel homolog
MSSSCRLFIILMTCLGYAGAQQGPAVTQGQVLPAGSIPLMNVGGGYMESVFASVDFAQMTLEQQSSRAKERAQQRQEMLASGMVSVLDLDAPYSAQTEFNRAANLLKEQKSKEAVVHLEKAIHQYPKFVSAHQGLGLAYLDLDDQQRARQELQAAVQLDAKFAPALLHLGRLELSQEHFEAAQADFEKAGALRPRDASLLMLLGYVQHRNHLYRHSIDTTVQLHQMPHAKMANAHYVAAASAVALRDYPVVKRELELFVLEDPANPLAPSARQQLAILARNQEAVQQAMSSAPGGAAAEARPVQTFPDSERLRQQLASLGENPEDEPCADCADPGSSPASPAAPPRRSEPARGFTFRSAVDEVAMFFSVSDHGRNITDLQSGEVQILDNDRPPAKLLQFAPQSALPLHLGLLIDTSGSVKEHFSFEKSTATKFLKKMLTGPSDLGFVGGFSLTPSVTQDFTSDLGQLETGIDKLQNSGGTALFDAVSFACWKLAAYPGRERVANVLVIVTDGEDNSSRTSLKQAIRDAEKLGVTIYTISTQNHEGPKSGADKVLVEMSERSGGTTMFPGDIVMLGRAFDKLHDIVRNRYLLAYKPADFTANGAYHSIRIVAERDKHRFQVRTRKGYYAANAGHVNP